MLLSARATLKKTTAISPSFDSIMQEANYSVPGKAEANSAQVWDSAFWSYNTCQPAIARSSLNMAMAFPTPNGPRVDLDTILTPCYLFRRDNQQWTHTDGVEMCNRL